MEALAAASSGLTGVDVAVGASVAGGEAKQRGTGVAVVVPHVVDVRTGVVLRVTTLCAVLATLGVTRPLGVMLAVGDDVREALMSTRRTESLAEVAHVASTDADAIGVVTAGLTLTVATPRPAGALDERAMTAATVLLIARVSVTPSVVEATITARLEVTTVAWVVAVAVAAITMGCVAVPDAVERFFIMYAGTCMSALTFTVRFGECIRLSQASSSSSLVRSTTCCGCGRFSCSFDLLRVLRRLGSSLSESASVMASSS